MLLHAEFLAIALVMVYVGAVMVLFLFVVMMLDINLERIRQGFLELLARRRADRNLDGCRDGHGPWWALLWSGSNASANSLSGWL
jgi:hypothetical protein